MAALPIWRGGPHLPVRLNLPVAMKATTKDFRLHASELIAATDRGEEVIITCRGTALARFVPLADGQKPVDRTGRNPAFGLWTDRPGTVEEQIDSLREGRHVD